MSVEEYINYYKNMLVYPQKYPEKFEILYKFIKNRLECDENSLFKLQYGLSFYIELHESSFKNIHKNWPLFTIEQYKILVELYLELIGFKKYVKDYVLICAYSFCISETKILTTVQKDQFIGLNFQLLFDKPDFSNIKDIDLENDYFNEKLFNIQSERESSDHFYWYRLREFTDAFFYKLFFAVDSGSLAINYNLSLNDLYKIKDETLTYLNEFYNKKNRSLFSGGATVECLHGYQYYTEKDILSGKYGIERKTFSYIFFFSVKIPWINFALGWENRLFVNSDIITRINSDFSITFAGNCIFLLETHD